MKKLGISSRPHAHSFVEVSVHGKKHTSTFFSCYHPCPGPRG
jgi:hypothetical protein